jgi:hypothetical protein
LLTRVTVPPGSFPHELSSNPWWCGLRGVQFRLAAFAPICTRLDFPSKERRHIKALAIGIVVGILLLGRLADWFEESSLLLWLVFYLLAGGLTIAPFGTPMPVTSRPRGSDHLVHSLAWLTLFCLTTMLNAAARCTSLTSISAGRRQSEHEQVRATQSTDQMLSAGLKLTQPTAIGWLTR